MCVLVERQEEGRGVDQIVCRGHQRLAIRGRPAAELGLHDWHGVHACSPLSSRAAAATASREASALCSKGGSCPLPRAHGEAARHISAATRESSAISAAAASASSTLFTPHAGCLEGWLRSRIGRPPTLSHVEWPASARCAAAPRADTGRAAEGDELRGMCGTVMMRVTPGW